MVGGHGEMRDMNNKERNSYEVLSCFSRGYSRKKGQFFALILVFITLFLCGIVWVSYGIQQRNIDNSLVSPRVIFEIRDDLEIFEIRERALINSLVESVDGDFGSEEFIEDFRNGFMDGVIENGKMSEFIFDGLVFGGRDYEADARVLGREFLDINLYSDVVSEDGKLVFNRNIMGKRIFLNVLDKSKINFPVEFKFEFAKNYFIDVNGVVD